MRQQKAAEEQIGGSDREGQLHNVVLDEFEVRMAGASLGYVTLRRIQSDGSLWLQGLAEELRGPAGPAAEIHRDTEALRFAKFQNRAKKSAALRLVDSRQVPQPAACLLSISEGESHDEKDCIQAKD